MRDRTHDTPPPPANAFAAPFLDLLDPEDDPLTATEAAAEGPWTVVRVAAPKIPFAEPDRPELWAVVREGLPADTEPAATFVHLHPARLASAALPIAARDAAYRLDRTAPRAASRCATPAASPAISPGTTRSSSSRSTTSTPCPVAAGARRGARGGGDDGAPAGRRSLGGEVGVNASQAGWAAILERRRYFDRGDRPWKKKVYAPALRRDQLKALHYLKHFEGRPMTKLLQEALDRYLEPHGGVEALIERGVAEIGERGEVRCQRCSGR